VVARQVIVVGAGPAGVRAAETLVAAGLRPIVVDESTRDGGQIYRRQPAAFRRPYEQLYGTEATKAKALHRSFDALRERIDYRPETLAWNVAGGRLYVANGSRTERLYYDALIVCPGATDRVIPVAGWHYAGTYTLGGAQVALKSQACAIGRRTVFFGTGPLLYLVAAQYVAAGANVAAVLDTSPWSLRIGAATKLLANVPVLAKGARLTLALRSAGVTMRSGVEPVAIDGAPDTGVGAFRWRDARGRERRIECDAVALGYHLRPETQLADLAKCRFRFDDATRQWLPEVDVDGRSTTPGVYLAGDGTRVLGADAAEHGGELVALAALADLGVQVDAARVARLRSEVARYARFAAGLMQAFPWPAGQARRVADETIVCRCEAVTAGELRRVVVEAGAREANRAKAFSRVGMGRCQGRYCGHAAAEIIAAAAGTDVAAVGRLRSQAPVKPIPISMQLAADAPAASAPATAESLR
jgi:NADPH-dependent 2,4-dienoyl-CoA reductase/sulfur reductase-like enzyme